MMSEGGSLGQRTVERRAVAREGSPGCRLATPHQQQARAVRCGAILTKTDVAALLGVQDPHPAPESDVAPLEVDDEGKRSAIVDDATNLQTTIRGERRRVSEASLAARHSGAVATWAQGRFQLQTPFMTAERATV